MNDVVTSQQDITKAVQAENIQFPEQANALGIGGIDVCQALPVVITLLENIPSANPLIKLGITVVVSLLKKYQESHCQ